MIDDIRNSKNLKIYLEQLDEIKARLEHIASYINEDKDRFLIESHALQVRKIIELVAFSLLAIHSTKYKDFRAKAGKDFTNDWNGRDIITDVLKLNPDMFFRATYKGFTKQQDGIKQIKLREESECYTLKRLAKLYDRCGGVLHVSNPWKNSNKIELFHNELPSIIKKLEFTLSDHVVLVNHWQSEESTVVVFTLSGPDGKPTYALAHAPGNFTFNKA
jgi:hypothetical protein